VRVPETCDVGKTQAEAYLGSIKGTKARGHRTFNHYVQAPSTFGRWLHANGRVRRHPFAGMAKLNAAEHVRHEQRALTPAPSRAVSKW
jgi:hypothetical protein